MWCISLSLYLCLLIFMASSGPFQFGSSCIWCSALATSCSLQSTIGLSLCCWTLRRRRIKSSQTGLNNRWRVVLISGRLHGSRLSLQEGLTYKQSTISSLHLCTLVFLRLQRWWSKHVKNSRFNTSNSLLFGRRVTATWSCWHEWESRLSKIDIIIKYIQLWVMKYWSSPKLINFTSSPSISR